MSTRILIVDDEPVIIHTLTLIFQQAGYEAVAYNTGIEALENAKSIPPDLALIDALLPGRDGVSIAMELSQVAPRCKVLLFSGVNDASALVRRAAEQGFDFELLAKPISPPELLEKVKSKLATLQRAHGAAG